MSNRILDYPEATEITSNDYILLDNEGTGAKCIKASALNINMDNYTIKEARGAIASFDDGEDLPLAFMGAYITAIQEGSGDPSPTNIRPISGWSAVDVNVSGVNQWDEEWELGGYSATTGNKTSSTYSIRAKNKIAIMPNTSYYCSFTTGAMNVICFYDKNRTFIADSAIGISAKGVITTPNNAYFMSFQMSAPYGTTYNNDISINYPSTDTSYHAYNGATYTLDLDGTRYGGTLDVVSGVLTVDRAIRLVSNCTWYGSNGGFYTDAVLSSIQHGDGRFDHVISNVYKTENISSITPLSDGGISVDASGYVQLKDSRYSTASDFKANMGTTQLVYELATPLTYQLSKQQIKSLVGVNNIFADTGDSVVDYRKLWVMPEM